MKPGDNVEIWLANVFFENKKTQNRVALHNMVVSRVPLVVLQDDIYFNRRCQRSYSTLKTELSQLTDHGNEKGGLKKIVHVEFIRKISDSNLTYEQYLKQRSTIGSFL